ncbi:MAG: YhdT family protein [Selenomonadaceae bacterium]|nr:YhdT family protein [Selenomonadaceae bacterium]
MKEKLSDAEKFSLVKREAIYTGLALVGLIIFWLIVGFGTASIEEKIFHLPLWAFLGSIGVWFFAIFISFILSKKLFRDVDLEGKDDGK